MLVVRFLRCLEALSSLFAFLDPCFIPAGGGEKSPRSKYGWLDRWNSTIPVPRTLSRLGWIRGGTVPTGLVLGVVILDR